MNLREWTARLLGSLTRRRSDDDLQRELRAHLELAEEDAWRRGWGEDAARAARLAVGHETAAMDA
jgi:hypothetical protein